MQIHLKFDIENMHSRDRIVVSTLRCGRNNPGSNPGLDNIFETVF